MSVWEGMRGMEPRQGRAWIRECFGLFTVLLLKFNDVHGFRMHLPESII